MFTITASMKPVGTHKTAYTITGRILRCQTNLAKRTFVSTTVRLSQPQQKYSKVYGTADEAVADVKSGSTILSSGFGLCGVAGASKAQWRIACKGNN